MYGICLKKTECSVTLSMLLRLRLYLSENKTLSFDTSTGIYGRLEKYIARQRLGTTKHQIIINISICKVFHADICCLSVLQSLCSEIKQRRRGVASVLRLCQHLLDDQETCNLNADHQSMQLIIVNLERRWEAIVMQAVHWQTRLQKRLEKDSVSDACFKRSHAISFFARNTFSAQEKHTHLWVFSSDWDAIPSLYCLQVNLQFFTQHCMDNIF